MSVEEAHHVFAEDDHQVAFIFDPDETEDATKKRERPSKRRRVVDKAQASDNRDGAEDETLFMPLLNGVEAPECVRLRQRLFQESWCMIETRIQNILRESNSATLDQVSAFVSQAGTECGDRIPSAFIITGPNFASQDLLFEQLSERLSSASSGSRFVRLRSTEAVNVKTALKKIIRDATSSAPEEDEDGLQVGQGKDDRRYLDYDLEALEAFTRSTGCDHVFVGFQDTEAFESSLLSDLITLFSSWRPRIPLTLLFGIATSVELLQARLLKSACRLVYGAQFDGVQTQTILENVFRGAVASSDVPLRLGAGLLRGMLDRQHDHVAGIQAFISSLKYAYMCHFYANPLSILLAPEAERGMILQVEHFEAIRNLPSVRISVEDAVEAGTRESLAHARSLLESDEYLLARIQESEGHRQQWIDAQLRCLLVEEAAGATHAEFSRAYVGTVVRDGHGSDKSKSIVDYIRQMTIESLIRMLHRIMCIFRDGERSIHLGPATEDQDVQLLASLGEHVAQLEGLRHDAEKAGIDTLRSKYSGVGKVMRTTVVAQRVQLRRDPAALREEDMQFTKMMDGVTELLTGHFGGAGGGGEGLQRWSSRLRWDSVLLSEGWVYDSKSPLREVMVPRPRAAFERSLARPHDYLSCACCTDEGATDGGGIRSTLPATCILYHLYLEAGSLINMADMWSAFSALVDNHKERGEEEEAQEEQGEEHDGGEDEDGGDDHDAKDRKGEDERRALVMFYRGLAELRLLGFIKASKKKTDHIAKVRWL